MHACEAKHDRGVDVQALIQNCLTILGVVSFGNQARGSVLSVLIPSRIAAKNQRFIFTAVWRAGSVGLAAGWGLLAIAEGAWREAVGKFASRQQRGFPRPHPWSKREQASQ